MASEDEVRLGRLAVKRGWATEEQVLAALRTRNARPSGPDLGAVLESLGLVDAARLGELRRAIASGEGTAPVDRTDASTEHEIKIGGVREILARDQLQEALAHVKKDPKAAYRELRRLAREFSDTESGVAAEREARGLARTTPGLEGQPG